MSWFGFGGGKKDDSAGLGDSEASSTFDNFSGGGSSFEDPGTTFDNTASLGTSDRLENVAALACITHKIWWIVYQMRLDHYIKEASHMVHNQNMCQLKVGTEMLVAGVTRGLMCHSCVGGGGGMPMGGGGLEEMVGDPCLFTCPVPGFSFSRVLEPLRPLTHMHRAS